MLEFYRKRTRGLDVLAVHGRVSELVGLTASVKGLSADLGEVCRLHLPDRDPVLAEVVGFRGGEVLIMPLEDLTGIGPGTPVSASGQRFSVPVSDRLLGRVLDGLGRPLDRKPMPVAEELAVNAAPPDPMTRAPIEQRISLGVRALDTLIPCGKGQRLGIFAGSGVGKSSLMGMIARYSSAQVNVICLVGERGREVQDFIYGDLGPEGLARSVVVCATSDRPALERIKAVLVATTIAEFFRDQGRDVMFMCDSVTRLAMAQREVGLAVGEPPATRGYPPSVWALLPQVLERAGATHAGSITGLYTVLVEGDDMNEPVADAVRAILDGHIALDRKLAHRNHYPAIDVLGSVSRLQGSLLADDVKEAGGAMREVLAAYRAKEDMISLGVYENGANPQIDYAISKLDDFNGFLRQRTDEPTPAEDADRMLIDMMADRPGLLVSTAADAAATVTAAVTDLTEAIPRVEL